MVNEVEVKAKTDSELLEIWEHQNDYIPGMVTRVKAEIERRNLDTRGVHVISLEEIKEKEGASQIKSDRRWARAMALFNIALGLYSVSIALTRAEPLVVSGILLALALMLIVVSFGVWMRKRWALIAGLILYAFMGAWDIVESIVSHFRHADLYTFVVPFFCVFMAVTFNRLRKRAR